jgi:hypothetical protein
MHEQGTYPIEYLALCRAPNNSTHIHMTRITVCGDLLMVYLVSIPCTHKIWYQSPACPKGNRGSLQDDIMSLRDLTLDALRYMNG